MLKSFESYRKSLQHFRVRVDCVFNIVFLEYLLNHITFFPGFREHVDRGPFRPLGLISNKVNFISMQVVHQILKLGRFHGSGDPPQLILPHFVYDQ